MSNEMISLSTDVSAEKHVHISMLTEYVNLSSTRNLMNIGNAGFFTLLQLTTIQLELVRWGPFNRIPQQL
jgi:hypothetical protein